jgi:hypothetical protein
MIFRLNAKPTDQSKASSQKNNMELQTYSIITKNIETITLKLSRQLSKET